MNVEMKPILVGVLLVVLIIIGIAVYREQPAAQPLTPSEEQLANYKPDTHAQVSVRSGEVVINPDGKTYRVNVRVNNTGVGAAYAVVHSLSSSVISDLHPDEYRWMTDKRLFPLRNEDVRPNSFDLAGRYDSEAISGTFLLPVGRKPADDWRFYVWGEVRFRDYDRNCQLVIFRLSSDPNWPHHRVVPRWIIPLTVVNNASDPAIRNCPKEWPRSK